MSLSSLSEVSSPLPLLNLLKRVYEGVQGESDIIHALPEDSLICTLEDEISIVGGGETKALKGIFTYEEIKM